MATPHPPTRPSTSNCSSSMGSSHPGVELHELARTLTVLVDLHRAYRGVRREGDVGDTGLEGLDVEDRLLDAVAAERLVLAEHAVDRLHDDVGGVGIFPREEAHFLGAE